MGLALYHKGLYRDAAQLIDVKSHAIVPMVAPSSIASARLVALVGVLLCTAASRTAAQVEVAPAVRQILLSAWALRSTSSRL